MKLITGGGSEKNAKIGIFSGIILPPQQGISQAKRVNINDQKNDFCPFNNMPISFNERKRRHQILAALTFRNFHFGCFGYLNRGRGGLSIIETRAETNRNSFSTTGGLVHPRGNSRDNYNYPRLVEHQFPSSINPFLIGSRSQAASFGLR